MTRKLGDGGLSDISRDGKYILYGQNRQRNRVVPLLTSAPEKAVKEIFIEWFSRYCLFSWDSKNVIYQDSIGVWVTPVDVNKGRRLIKAPKQFSYMGITPDDGSLLGTIFNPETHLDTFVKLDPVGGNLEEIAKVPPRSSFFHEGSLFPDGTTYAFGRYETRNRITVLDNFR